MNQRQEKMKQLLKLEKFVSEIVQPFGSLELRKKEIEVTNDEVRRLRVIAKLKQAKYKIRAGL